MSSPSATPTPVRTPGRRKVNRSPITSEAEREQALRDYKVTIEYKHLKQHAPGGVYVIPSFDNLRFFHGVIFLRRGLYTNGIFKFQIQLPPKYNHNNTRPRIIFSSHVYNPHVNDETGELDIESAYPHWDSHKHYLVTVLTYLKKIFYIKSFPDHNGAVANVEARDLARSNPKAYRQKIDKCVRESKRSIYMNEPNCTIIFKEETVCHEILRQLMTQNFKDPHTISKAQILDCVKQAKGGGEERMDAEAQAAGEEEGIQTEAVLSPDGEEEGVEAGLVVEG